MNGSSRTPALRGPSGITGTRQPADVVGDCRHPLHAHCSDLATSRETARFTRRNCLSRLQKLLPVALVGLALSACTETGDFGRPKAGVWNSLILPTAGNVAAQDRGEPVSAFPLTDAEQELRSRSWRFLTPAHDRAWFDRELADLTRTRVLPTSDHPSDPRIYYQALVGEPFASPASRFRRIGDDAEADRRLLDPFGAVAARVIAADHARLRSLAFVHDLTQDQVADASARVIENRCLIAWVRAELRERTDSYRYALEHAFIAMPQEQAAETERSVKALDAHRHVLDGLPVPPWRNGICIAGAAEHPPKRPRPLVVKG
jgi:hypothetical protein